MRTLMLFLLIILSPVALAENLSLQIIMDDSGVLLEPEKAQTYKLRLLAQLKSLASRRTTSRAQIDVISTSLGRTIWSGTPMTLRRNPARSIELINAIKADPARCNNLPGAFEELRSNLAQINREGVEVVHIIVFSSLIDTPRPCAEDTPITLPQLPPVEGDITGALLSSSAVHSISFYWISPHQKRVWEEFLAPVFINAQQSGMTINVHDVARSKQALQDKGLKLGDGS